MSPMTEQKLRDIQGLVFSGQFRQGLRLLRELERNNPKDPNLVFNRGGFLIDIGTGLRKRDLVTEGIEACDRALKFGIFPERLLYNLGNGYSNLACLITPTKRHNPDDELLQKAKWCHREILERKLMSNNELLCQLHTNLGNTYERLGRRVEALRQYNNALDINPKFGMALGNKAICLIYAARITGAHVSAMMQEAYLCLCEAIRQPIEPDHRKSFISWKERLAARYGFTEPEINSFEEDMKSIIAKEPSEFGRYYLTYCLDNDLFLNFCPKLGHGEARIEDPIFITIVTKARDNNTFYRFASYLNQIKEDYLLARYFLVQAQKTSAELEFVENRTQRVDTLEYREYSVYLELAKESFEKSVNLLDRIACFLNEYCSVRMPDHRVSFFGNDSIWNFKEKKTGKQPMRAFMKHRTNFALYGLYDLYLDFAREIEISGNEYAAYCAKLKRIRNSITHRYLKVYMNGFSPKKRGEDGLESRELTEDCLTILRVARAAVIYLIDFVNTESEKKKEKSKGPVLPMYTFSIPKRGKDRV